MQRLDWSRLSPEARAAALARPPHRRDPEVAGVVASIFADVAQTGEAAVRRWSERLDARPPETLMLDPAVVKGARARLSAEDLAALELAVAHVRLYHEAARPPDESVWPRPGLRCRRIWRPIGCCGLYIPGGAAPLFSTLVMLAEPARVAGVRERVALTPPRREGVHPMMVAAAAACGLDALTLLGGAQAIAALAYGAGLPKADKIFGPGNAYVAEAKRMAAALPGGPQIDLPAGPSELLVIADASGDPELIAADLLSQAEHDADAQTLLVSPSAELLAAVMATLDHQLADLPRAGVARAALAHGRAILAADLAEAAAIANAYAPEHLALQVGDPEALLARIEHAGAVFLGARAAEAFGDYLAGPSHVLATDGAARSWSGVSTESFMKRLSVQELSAAAAAALAGPTARLARLEGLEAHARAAELRAR